jgi:hypothetical protein
VFAQGVRTPEHNAGILTGAFTWAAARLDDPPLRRDRTWFDTNIDRAQAEKLLKRRIYETDTSE